MSRVTPVQSSFNGGELSKRLQGRIDQSVRDIAVADMVGFVPLMEGGMEACPGLIRIAPAKGPCVLKPFEFNVTQGHVLEFSDAAIRVFTNDAQVESAPDVPFELASPYSYAQLARLNVEQSYDVAYLFHGDVETRQFVRLAADDFAIETVTFENGPFEDRNKDESLTVRSTGVSGAVTLSSSAALFEAGDIGGLFRMEADDFGTITSWEPGITVTNGQLLTWGDKVYRVAGGTGRTGTVAPIHVEGVEWDGIGSGTDINGTAAGGVQLEFIHDRIGILRITGYTDAQTVSATVVRRLPFTAVATSGGAGTYHYGGGYYDDAWVDYEPPASALPSYNYGTWRWRFGAFSTRRGFPEGGVLWNERLVLWKGSTLYGSAAGALTDHNPYNELGEITTDMAFVVQLKDPNAITGMVSGDRLLAMTASGVFAIGPSNAASGVGPGNLRCDRQNHAGCSTTAPVQIDGRTVYIGRSRRRVFEGGYELSSGREEAIDLTRYARHIGNDRLIELASARDPQRLLWAVRENGSLIAAAYVPEEQVLGWAPRSLCDGALARSIATITDPAGELNQLWVAVEFEGGWHICRMAQFRNDGETTDTAVMVDMAYEYEGAAVSTGFSCSWLTDRTVACVADDKYIPELVIAPDGTFSLPFAASRVVAGLPYEARVKGLDPNAGGDNGPSITKTKRIPRVALIVESSRGLSLRGTGGQLQPMENLRGDSPVDAAIEPYTGTMFVDGGVSDWTRNAWIEVVRDRPYEATILAWQPTIDASQR